MKFHFAEERLAYVEPMFRKIADQYLKMLGASFLFQAKLDVLDVLVDGDMGEDDFHGSFCFDDLNNRCRIKLHVTPERSEAETALLIAHELGHLMISNTGVGSMLRGADGDIIMHFGVMRSEGRGEIIGIGLEEGIVEFMAAEVVSRVSEEWGRELKRSEYRKEEASLAEAAEELSKCFGKRLQRLEKFDQTMDIGKKIAWANDLTRPAEVVSAFRNIDNLFWQCLAKQSFGLIGTIYDEIMGAGEFRNLCMRFEAVYSPFGNADSSAEELLLLKLLGGENDMAKEVLEEIRRFRKLKAQKDREYAGVGERKIAGDSIKAAFDRMKKYCRAMQCPEADEEYKRAAAAFYGALNKGRVWKSVPEACAALKRLEVMEVPIIASLYLPRIRQIMDAVCEVAAHYGVPTTEGLGAGIRKEIVE